MKGRGSESEAAIVQAEECCLFMSEEVKVVIENAAHIWVGVERLEIISDKPPVYRGSVRTGGLSNQSVRSYRSVGLCVVHSYSHLIIIFLFCF